MRHTLASFGLLFAAAGEPLPDPPRWLRRWGRRRRSQLEDHAARQEAAEQKRARRRARNLRIAGRLAELALERRETRNGTGQVLDLRPDPETFDLFGEDAHV